MMKRLMIVLIAMLLLAACASATPSAAPTRVIPATLDPGVEPTEFLPTLAATPTAFPANTAAAESTRVGGASATPAPTLSPADWQKWPVIPNVSQTAREIYQKGLKLGNYPNRFSKVGDCQNVSSYFLAVFENPDEYRLGPHADLQETVDYFEGSFARNSAAVRGGFNVASVLSTFWADPAVCDAKGGESPLACELRLHRPAIVIISMETWWSGRPASDYEGYLRQIVEFSIERGAVPILATKADNWEGDHSLNAAIARVAADYDVPLWNFWLAVQPLPNHGLTEDGFHLTYARNFFDDPVRMQSAWPVRNLTALQVLDAVRKGVSVEDYRAR